MTKMFHIHRYKIFSISHTPPAERFSCGPMELSGHAIKRFLDFQERVLAGTTSVVQRCSVCGGLAEDVLTGIHRIKPETGFGAIEFDGIGYSNHKPTCPRYKNLTYDCNCSGQ